MDQQLTPKQSCIFISESQYIVISTNTTIELYDVISGTKIDSSLVNNSSSCLCWSEAHSVIALSDNYEIAVFKVSNK